MRIAALDPQHFALFVWRELEIEMLEKAGVTTSRVVLLMTPVDANGLRREN